MQLIKAKRKQYIEIGQTKSVSFSFCNKTEQEGETILTQIFHWIKCRDFLSDVLYSEQIKQIVNVCHFSYNPEKCKIDRDKTRLLVKISNKEERKFFEENISILHKIEEKNEFEKTKVTKITPYIYLVEADVYWLKTTQLISCYTFLIRCLCYQYQDKLNWYKELELQYNTIEGSYLSRMSSKFKSAIYQLRKVFDVSDSVHGYTGYVTFWNVHNAGGILTCWNVHLKLDKTNVFRNQFHKEFKIKNETHP